MYLRVQTILIQKYEHFLRILIQNAPLANQVSIHGLKNDVYGDILLQLTRMITFKKLCEVFLVTSEWGEDVNIPNYKSP